jgi:imidazole glycerol-phosphate synthase subunit HisF
MLRPRIIPCLLVKNGALVKTVKFSSPRYVGDPINAVRIFNEKEVDELVVLDIDASAQERDPDFGMIRDLACECRMPLCYGGGVKTVEQVERIVSLGVEKVAMSSAAVSNPQIIFQSAKVVGSQSIVVIMDVDRKAEGGYELRTHNGGKPTGLSPMDFARQVEDLGAGEVVINSIERDGLMSGYDLELIGMVRAAINLPITVLGGAGSMKDIAALIDAFGVIGAAAGSLFVFKGVYRAVLINYPTRAQKEQVFAAAGIFS